MSNEVKQDPIIWDVLDGKGERINTIVAHTSAEARKSAKSLYGDRVEYIVDTGKRKPPNHCCDTCGDVPCEKRK